MKPVLLTIVLMVGLLCGLAAATPVAADGEEDSSAIYAVDLPGISPGATGTPDSGDKPGPQISIPPGGATPIATVPPTLATIAPILTVTPGLTAPATVAPSGSGSYGLAKVYYEAGGRAWAQAWGASDVRWIRQYLVEAKTAYSNCLITANSVNDPANAANLALLQNISSSYVALADAAIAMYDGGDYYGAGRTLMDRGNFTGAAASFQSAGDTFARSQVLFTLATTTLQGVSYAGTEFGDGTAYTAAITPILDAKAAYMEEFATYARGWQHTALAYEAGSRGDTAGFRNEAVQAMNLFAALQASPSFGADASANYQALASMVQQVPIIPAVTTPVAIF